MIVRERCALGDLDLEELEEEQEPLSPGTAAQGNGQDRNWSEDALGVSFEALKPAPDAITPDSERQAPKLLRRRSSKEADKIDWIRKELQTERTRELKRRWGVGDSSRKVDEFLEPPENSKYRHAAHEILTSTVWDFAIGIIIIANSVTIGMESHYSGIGEDTSVFEYMENFFMTAYICELALRFFAHGLRCLQSGWVMFDFVLVGLGRTTALYEMYLRGFQTTGDDNVLGALMVLRTLRLARLARTIRLFAQFKALWMLVRGLLSSAGTMAYTFLLIVLILYVFACISVELITNNKSIRADAVLNEFVEEYWSDIPSSMLTLVKFVTLDNASQIYDPMIRRSWQHDPWVGALL